MNCAIRYILSFALCLSVMAELAATHVAGGSMTYRCLGNSRYEISLEFRRDCFNGAMDAQFDRFASVTIFNSDNQLMVNLGAGGELRIPFIEDDTLNERITSVCNVIGEDVCIQTTLYRDTVILPERPGGYILAYQRCCRNNATVNVSDPLNTGATYWVRITEKALQECNNSPVFDNLPGVFLCVNDTLRFDHSASDSDGDSLVYFLCTPSAGASEPDPMPQPSNPPPFEPIEWAPGFSENNMMGGSPISVDQNTGELLAVPNQVGIFLIGICVREYRDGVLLSEVRRDFQYAVRVCGRAPIAAFQPDSYLKCDGLDIQFENNSTSNFLPIDSITYEWTFDYPVGDLTSTEVSPLFSFPESGLYDVRLVATDGMCYDTTFATIGVSLEDDPTAAFSFDAYNCEGETVVQFFQNSVTTQLDSEHIWTVRYGNVVADLTGTEPELNIGSDQEILVTYEIKTESGCNDIISEQIQIETIQLEAEYIDKIVCSGEDVVVFSTDIPNLQVDIVPDDDIISDGMGNYIINDFSGSRDFEITIMDDFCMDQGVVNITSDEEPEFPLPDIIQCGQDTVYINENGPEFYYYVWDGPQIANVNAVNPAVSLMEDGDYSVTVFTTEGSLCSFTDSLTVRVSEMPEPIISASQQTVLCEGDDIELSLNELYAQIRWEDDQGTFLGDEQSIFITGLTRTTMYSVSVVTDDGCTNSASYIVEYSGLPVINISGNTMTRVCEGEDALLSVVSLDSLTWLDSDGEVLGTGFQYTLENVTEETVLTVRATNQFDCEDEIDITVSLYPQLDTDLSPLDSIFICPGMVIPFNLETDEEVRWYNEANELIQEGTELMIQGIEETQQYYIELENEFGCTGRDSFYINVDPGIVPDIDLMVLDSIMVCEETDFSVTLSSTDSILWLDLNENILGTGTDFLFENITDTLVLQVSVVDEFNCELRDTFQINPFSSIDLEISSSQQQDFFCEGESIDLGTSTNVNADIEWYLGNQLLATGDSLINYFPEGDLILEAIATDRYGCMSNDSFLLRESPTGGEISGNDLICIDSISNLVFTPDAEEEVYSIMWVPSEPIIDDAGLSITVLLDTTETFYVTYVNGDGCETEDSITVDVSGFFNEIEAFASPDEIFLGETTELSTDQDPDFNYEWSPADLLDDPFDDNPIATLAQTQTFVVTVTDDLGCSGTAEVTVEVMQPECDESDIFIPNMFSPNGDNINDIFRVESNFIEEQDIVIYNRWGEEIFSSNEPDAEWDGTYNGKPVSSDVYAYYVKIICINGVEYSKKGNITVFR